MSDGVILLEMTGKEFREDIDKFDRNLSSYTEQDGDPEDLDAFLEWVTEYGEV